MIKQGLKIEIIPTPGTAALYTAVVYSTGWEGDHIEIQRHVFNLPLERPWELMHPGEFGLWMASIVAETSHQVTRRQEEATLPSVSAAYAQAEDEQDKASHRM